jgi:hypothetical protein
MRLGGSSEGEIGLIGAGRIAQFHLDALNSAGLQVSDIAASFGSSKVHDFAKENQISNVWKDPFDLIANANCTAYVILAPTEPTVELLKFAMKFKKPILVEKPITHNSKEFNELDISRKDVMVGYNRRFYPEVQKLKKLISERSYVNLRVEIPETISSVNTSLRSKFYPVFQNSVHMLDLVQYLVGDLKLESRLESPIDIGTSAISALLSSVSGHTVNLLLNFNAAANFSITIDDGKSRYVLCPIEEVKYFDGMTVFEPTKDRPYRVYSPNLVSSVRSDPRETLIKPGFHLQAIAFRDLINKIPNDDFASLSSTFNLVKLTEQILNII